MSTLSIIIDASTRGMGAFAEMATSLAGVKASAKEASASLDETKASTDATSGSMTLLNKANVDAAASIKGARTEVDNIKQALISHGVATRDADAATKGLLTTMARKSVVTDLRNAMQDAGVSTRGLGSALSAMASNLVQAESDSGGANSGFQNLLATLKQTGTVLGSVGSYVMPALIVSMVSVGLATTPLVIAFAGWLTITTGLAIGLAGLAATAAIFLGGLGLLAGGMIALVIATQGWAGTSQSVTTAQKAVTTATNANASAQQALQRAQLAVTSSAKPTAAQLLALQQAQDKAATAAQNLTDAQNKLANAQKSQQNPLQQTESIWQKVANTLGAAATPAVGQMLDALNKLAPTVQAIALQWINWYDSLSPQAISDFMGIAQGLLSILQQLTPTIEGLTNRFLQMWPYLQPIIQGFAQLGAQTIVSLISHLLDLSEWFLNVWPQAGGIAGQGFSLLGNLIQGVIQFANNLFNFFVRNWPTISSLARASSDAFGVVFQVVGWIWQQFSGQLAPAIQFLTQHTQELVWVLIALASPIILATVLILGIVGIVVTFIQMIVQLIVWCEQLAAWLGTNIPVAIRAMGDYFSQFGANAHNVWNQFVNEIQSGANSIGGFFSAIGTGASNLESAIGGVFSGLGTDVRKGLQDVANVIGGFDTAVDNLPVIGGMLNLPKTVTFAEGGIVNSPTFGVFGEAGPEALIPLGRGSRERGLNLWKQAGQALGLGGVVEILGSSGALECLGYLVSLGFTAGAGVPAAIDLANRTQAGEPAGSVGISTLPPFGHAWLNLGNGLVLDSNWVGPDVIAIHDLSDIPDQAGSIPWGVNVASIAGNVAGTATNVASTLNITGKIQGLVNSALGGLGGWEGTLAKGLLNKIVSGIGSQYGSGGPGAIPRAVQSRGRGAGAGSPSITINMTGNADPRAIAREIGWALRIA